MSLIFGIWAFILSVGIWVMVTCYEVQMLLYSVQYITTAGFDSRRQLSSTFQSSRFGLPP
jgi:hypothetical protein